jgi:hypothetical protein
MYTNALSTSRLSTVLATRDIVSNGTIPHKKWFI